MFVIICIQLYCFYCYLVLILIKNKNELWYFQIINLKHATSVATLISVKCIMQWVTPLDSSLRPRFLHSSPKSKLGPIYEIRVFQFWDSKNYSSFFAVVNCNKLTILHKYNLLQSVTFKIYKTTKVCDCLH